LRAISIAEGLPVTRSLKMTDLPVVTNKVWNSYVGISDHLVKKFGAKPMTKNSQTDETKMCLYLSKIRIQLTKRELCAELAKEFDKLHSLELRKPGECKNETNLLTNPFKTNTSVIDEFGYCWDIFEDRADEYENNPYGLKSMKTLMSANGTSLLLKDIAEMKARTKDIPKYQRLEIINQRNEFSLKSESLENEINEDTGKYFHSSYITDMNGQQIRDFVDTYNNQELVQLRDIRLGVVTDVESLVDAILLSLSKLVPGMKETGRHLVIEVLRQMGVIE
jgi:hypothetical protein